MRQKLELLSKKRFSRAQYYKKLNSARKSPYSVFENEATPGMRCCTSFMSLEDNENEIEEAISRLKQEGFINDKSFAEWYCTQRQEFNQRSRKLLMMELQMKGVDRPIIQEAVRKFHDEDASCLILAQRKLSVMEREKLISYLLRKVCYAVSI